jgi:glycosyltransferase involved in cell wall biosynthesis
MRVLHVIPSLDPADGGPPVVVIRLAAAQAAAGADVSVLFYERPGAHDHVRNSVEATPGGQRLHLHPLPAPTPVERFTAYAATRALRPLVRDSVDFLHVHGIWTPILAAAAKAAARAGIPYCITPHGMLDPWSLGRKRLKKQFALALVWRRLVNGAAFKNLEPWTIYGGNPAKPLKERPPLPDAVEDDMRERQIP